MLPFKIGFGYDVHRFSKGRELWLGGVKISYLFGLEGHSDADVLLHSICDALLGAAGLRDIGNQFPNNDMNFKDIDSKILLKRVYELITEKGFKIGNIDATVCAEEPKINPYIPTMQEVISSILHIQPYDISIKATTNEGMGFVGRKEGICSYSVILLYRHLSK